MHFTREMKLDPGIIISFCIQEPFTLRQVNDMAVFIYTCVRSFKSCKLFHLFRILTCYPACFIKWKSIKLYRCPVFLQQTILYHLELKFTNTTNDLFVPAMLSKQLSNAF